MSQILGVVGGSGIYQMLGLESIEEHAIDTPYGQPSDCIVSGTLGHTRLLFLPRHGRHHQLAPHEINYRANVCAMKKLGATALISLAAVGSMREDIRPGDVVIVDQYLDWTRRRVSTFFEDGVVAHVSLANPVCPLLAGAAAAAAERAGARVHHGGTYLCIDGPQFSTRAESLLYRSWGVSVIGMTAMPEAKLAREAQLPYCTVAFSTDYDCWHETEEVVSVSAVLAVLKHNGELAQRTLVELAHTLPDTTSSPATAALKNSLITRLENVTPEAHQRMAWLLHG